VRPGDVQIRGAVDQGTDRVQFSNGPQFVLNPYLLLSLAIYGIATLSWVLLLRNTELSKAYLVVALSVVLVAIAGTFLLREPLSARLVAGMVIILVGLAVALW
jgi:drug/metabolite transporter (DMT)-like permease